MRLYHNAFSPFSRKVLLALEYKNIEAEIVDGLALSAHDALAKVNARAEVPVLVDGDAIVSNSADIVAYLERRYPSPAIYPADSAAWARARAWERCADTLVDAVLTDISYWSWAERPDSMPEGLKEAAQRDLDHVYSSLEAELDGRDFIMGDHLTVADFAFFPHLGGVRALGVSFDHERHPRLLAWFKRLRSLKLFQDDLERAKQVVLQVMSGEADLERRRIFWRGDRIEWILARGYHEWFMDEIKADRVIWPGLTVPPPRSP